jgi:hypothetical protein
MILEAQQDNMRDLEINNPTEARRLRQAHLKKRGVFGACVFGSTVNIDDEVEACPMLIDTNLQPSSESSGSGSSGPSTPTTRS